MNLTKCKAPVNWRKKLYRITYWVMPPVLLFLILSRIDLQLLREYLKGTNLWMLALGISYYPVVVLVAGIRWKVTLSEYFHIRPSSAYLVRHYWIGMTLGFFSPGQLGLDVYRVVLVGRRYHHYLKAGLAILIEKAMALLTAVLLVICLYPIVGSLIVHHQPMLHRVVRVSYFVGILAITVTGLIVIVAWHRVSQRLMERVSGMVQRSISRAMGRVDSDAVVEDSAGFSRALSSLASPKPFVLVFAASLAIQLAAAIGNQIFFQAVGYDVPFLVNLFLTPLFHFIFLLPVSFGSLGIREGLYILLYGAFGVPPEVAVLVSFINLTGILINNAIGALMIWTERRDGNDPQVVTEREADSMRRVETL